MGTCLWIKKNFNMYYVWRSIEVRYLSVPKSPHVVMVELPANIPYTLQPNRRIARQSPRNPARHHTNHPTSNLQEKTGWTANFQDICMILMQVSLSRQYRRSSTPGASSANKISEVGSTSFYPEAKHADLKESDNWSELADVRFTHVRQDYKVCLVASIVCKYACIRRRCCHMYVWGDVVLYVSPKRETCCISPAWLRVVAFMSFNSLYRTIIM